MNRINAWYRGQKALSALKTLEQFKNKHNISVSEAFENIKGMKFSDFKAKFEKGDNWMTSVGSKVRSHDKVTKKEFRDIQRALNCLDKNANAGDSSARKVGLENAARKINDNEVLSYVADKFPLLGDDCEERYDEEDSEELAISAKKEDKQETPLITVKNNEANRIDDVKAFNFEINDIEVSDPGDLSEESEESTEVSQGNDFIESLVGNNSQDDEEIENSPNLEVANDESQIENQETISSVAPEEGEVDSLENFEVTDSNEVIDNDSEKIENDITNVAHNEAMGITDESTPEVENSTTGTGNIEIAVKGSTIVNAGNIVPNAQVKAFKEEIDNALNPWWRKGYPNPEKAPTIEQAFKSVQDKWNITPENFKNLDPNLQETICLKIYSPSGAREEVVLQSVVGDLDPDKFNHLYDGDNIRTSLKAAVTGALFCSLAYYEGSWKKVEEETKKLMSQIGIHTATDLDKLPQNCQDKCVEVLFKAGDGHRAGCIFKALGVEKLESKEDFDKLPRALQLVLRAKKTAASPSYSKGFQDAHKNWFHDVAEAVGSPKNGEALIGILPEENVRIEDGTGQNFSVVIPE